MFVKSTEKLLLIINTDSFSMNIFEYQKEKKSSIIYS